MGRLYEYSDSNEKDGYFVRGGTKNNNYTMRATALGKRLFDRLGYEPGIVNKERGPRIPSQLQWAMYDAGLLTTGGNKPSGTGFDGDLDIENTELTEDQIEELEMFVLDEGADNEVVQELADMLDIEVEKASRTPIWNLDESARADLESVYETKITEELDLDKRDGVEIVVTYESDLSREDLVIFGIDIIAEQDGMKDHYYQMLYDRESSNSVNTVTRGDVRLEERVVIDRQRGTVLEAMSEVPLLTGLEIGNPGEDLNILTLEGDLEIEYQSLS